LTRVTVEQVAKVTNFTRSRHYGAFVFDVWLPNTNDSGNSDSLEMVRQLFEVVLQRVLAPICNGTQPLWVYIQFGVVKETEVIGTFANNDIII
jgi:hypothetical protein